jgi:hypothetical protein
LAVNRHEIDLLEVSFTTRPMHGATEVLGWKSTTTGRARFEDLGLAELKAYGDQLVSDIETRRLRIASFEA